MVWVPLDVKREENVQTNEVKYWSSMFPLAWVTQARGQARSGSSP